MGNFEVPKELAEQTYEAIEKATSSGKIRKGVNEVTKAIERQKALLVAIASDVSPKELVMHLPVICEEKKIAYINVPTRKELGSACGISVPTSAVAIVDAGEAKDAIAQITAKISGSK